MAELVQLDTAASMVGKSEVTLRRLIKSGKIPFHKEKTLTGFVYMVDPDVVRSYYDGTKEGGEEWVAEEAGQQAEAPRRSSTVRVAVASENGTFSEYWQKKAEMYEERYNQEMVRHSHTREELGVWRGRAEQAQAMIVKLLPAPGESPESKDAERGKAAEQSSSSTLIIVFVVLTLLVILAGGALLYLQLAAQ